MKIVQEGESKILRSKSKDVTEEMFGTVELDNILKNMFLYLAKETDGVAIAAPQLDIPYNIFVISPSITKEKLVYINPKIIKTSKDKKFMQEGCLSVRWLYGDVLRHTKVTIEACDEHGKKFSRGASGLLAHIYQHETDHLDGILFIDSAINLEKLEDEAIEKIKNK